MLYSIGKSRCCALSQPSRHGGWLLGLTFDEVCDQLGLDSDEYRVLYDPLTWPEHLIPESAEQLEEFESIPAQLLTPPEQESSSVESEIDLAWVERRRLRKMGFQ